MADDLKSLLASYEFLNRSLEDYEERLMPAARNEITSERNSVFLDILRLQSNNDAVTLAQVSFIVDALGHLAGETQQARVLRSIGRQHLTSLSHRCDTTDSKRIDHFERQLEEAANRPNPEFMDLKAADLCLLDCLSDRVGILDANYQYRYTNPANARFHGTGTSEFIGAEAHKVVGVKCFRAVTKPTIDACFAGRSFLCYAGHHHGGPERVYSLSGDPIRDDGGRIVGALLVARDITDAPPDERHVHRVLDA